MQAITEIERIIAKKGKDNSNVFANIVFNLMSNLYQPYSEIMKMPLPLVFELMKILDKQNKDMEREMRKGRKR